MNVMHARLAIATLLVVHTLAGAASAEPPAGASSCSGCHAADASVATPVPRIAGRSAAEIAAHMQAFKTGQMPSTVMGRIARGFTDAEVEAIAEWYSRQKP
jgi:cytochrome c553